MKIDLSKYPHLLLDLDGTICSENEPLPGAVAFINRLVAQQRSFAILSNAASSPQSVAERLDKMGIAVPGERIFTAARAGVQFILQRYGRRPRVLDLCTKSTRSMLEGRVDFVEQVDQPCDAVFNGAPSCVYCTPERQRLALELLRRGAELISLCADRVFPSARGIEFGSGATAAQLSYASGVHPIFVGKPEKLFFMELCESLKMQPSDCVLIGDNLESDIAGAKNVGMATVLTLCGVTRAQDLEKLDERGLPDHVIQSLAEFA